MAGPEVVREPLAAIRALHAAAGDQGDAGVAQHFAAALADPAVAAQASFSARAI